jgi:hypothetical protein
MSFGEPGGGENRGNLLASAEPAVRTAVRGNSILFGSFFPIPSAFFFWKEVKDKHTNSESAAGRRQKAETHPD